MDIQFSSRLSLICGAWVAIGMNKQGKIGTNSRRFHELDSSNHFWPNKKMLTCATYNFLLVTQTFSLIKAT